MALVGQLLPLLSQAALSGQLMVYSADGQTIGGILYPLTPAEMAAGFSQSSTNITYTYGPSDIRRYGGVPGLDCTAAVTLAASCNGSVYFPYISSTPWVINSNPTIPTGVTVQTAFGTSFTGTGASTLGLIGTTFSQVVHGGLNVGPATTGSSLNVFSPGNWAAATFASTAQFTGPNKLTNANQSVTTTQIMLHGLNAEFVSVGGSSGADQKVWSYFADNSGNYNYRIENDALSATFTFMQIGRTGNSGTFGSHMPITSFLNGYGSLVLASTISNGYQAVLNAGGVAGFANGLQIIAGTTNGTDNALNIKNYNSSATLLNITGQGVTTLGAVSATGLVGLSVTGFASNTSPVATFGGTSSNFITITDGAGIVNTVGVSTGLSLATFGPSSNHGLILQTNNTSRIMISNTGGIGFFGAAATAQPTTGVGGSTFVVNSGTAINTNSTYDGYTLAQVVKALRQEGLLA